MRRYILAQCVDNAKPPMRAAVRYGAPKKKAPHDCTTARK